MRRHLSPVVSLTSGETGHGMKRKRLRLALAVCVVLAILAAALWLIVRPVQIDEQVLRQVKPGMTLDDVIEIVDIPPGDY